MENAATPMRCPPGDERCTGGSQGNGKPHTSFYGAGLVDALAAGSR